VLLCAPSGFGKTALLLSFLDGGASVLGDDYVIASGGGNIRSWPVRMNLYEEHLAERPDLRELAEARGRDDTCAIYRGRIADFFPDRVADSAPLAAVVCLVRGEELALEPRDPTWAARYNRRLLDGEFAPARATKMAAAFARGTEWQPMHGETFLAGLLERGPVFQLAIPYGVDWAEARDRILAEVRRP
jgi:hypothetical protein